ncbi:ABC-three component system protein [Marixanthomonas spongiae]|uniref:ABC-three component systems C-terminal domain-containing protein n=1 Tax=Marixanthomonas spongiae TaxID=2174845 RepID=A0A2U0I045_9FLAO|nr:ABC-three component system protein [Marixanthomonas spongiae]PVW14340.1 hypothetical protein DDV96_11115 [Marixanthomonas spongiae]
MSTDATSSWSGYIFQGDVALCKAIEKMHEIGLGTNENSYKLRLEEDEDFSLHTENIEYFQVKAYTAHHYTNYKKAWDDMMERFPDHPQNNYLYVQKEGIDKSKFSGVINSIHIQDNLVSGKYTLANINEKLNDSIIAFLNNDDLSDDDIANKLTYCSKKIADYVKKRHRENLIREIPFTEISNWLDEAPLALNENLFWHTIEKLFFEALCETSAELDLTLEEEIQEFNLLDNAISELEILDKTEFKNLFVEFINNTKKVGSNLRMSLADYTKKRDIQRVIGKALRKISRRPLYRKLCYSLKVEAGFEQYQLTTNTVNYDMADRIERIQFQKECEELFKSPISTDTDFYVTRSLNRSKKEMSEVLKSIFNVEEINGTMPEGKSIVLEGEEKLFGLISIGNAIKKLE